MSEITVGSVSVDVVPDARQFPPKLARQINPEAVKIGAEFGRLFGDAAQRQMAKGVKDGLSSGGRESTTQGSKSGEDYGGAFGRTLKARLEAAFRSLPDVQINADSTGADREIAALKAELGDLRDKRIGIDIDAATARAEVDRLSDQLRLLSQQSPDVQVRIEAGAASAELKKFGVEVDRLDGREIDIPVDVDTAGASAQLALLRGQAAGATGSMGGLLAAALLLGPALIPIGAVAVGAFGAIAAGALAAAGGIGVLVLALAPVIAAVQAVRASHDQSAQAARGSTTAHLQMAAAMDGVKTAQRGLASAQEDARIASIRASQQIQDAERKVADAERASARDRIDDARKIQDAKRDLADAVRQAADDQEAADRRLEDAEQSVADAQRSALEAQRALSDARKQAARDAEDLAAQVAGGVLDERDAVLRVQEAQERLAEVMADPQASDLQRQRAQLAVDEAIQGLKDQRTENARLREEKAASDKAGIDGSKAVKDAQDQVTQSQKQVADARRAAADAAKAQAQTEVDGARSIADAQQAVADAERDASRRRADDAQKVADAQRGVADATAQAAESQRRSAESIASAQQAVISAQRGVQQASQSAGATGGAAMDKVRDKLKALTPEGRKFVSFLTDEFLPQFSGLSKVAQRGLLPGLQAGLVAMKPLFRTLRPLVANFSEAMGDLFESAGKALGGKFWRDFFGYVGRVGPDLLETIGSIVGNLVTGFAGLVEAFDPVTRGFFAGLESLTQAFSNFGQNATQNSGFQKFIAYIQQVGPQVVSTFAAIAGAVGNILSALAPLGPIALTVVTALANLIAALPQPVIIGIVAGVIAMSVAMTALSIATSIAAAGFVTIGAVTAPIVLVIAAVIAAVVLLGIGIYELYKNWDSVWGGIKKVTSASWDFIKGIFTSLGNYVKDNVSAKFKAGMDLLAGMWRAFKDGVSTVWGVIRGIFNDVWQWIRDKVSAAFQREIDGLGRIWSGFKDGVSAAWGLIKGVFNDVWQFVRDSFVGNFRTWVNVLGDVWSGLKDGIKAAWDGKFGIKTIFVALRDFIQDHVVSGFTKGVDAIQTAWDKVKEIAAAPIRFVVDTVINKGLIGTYNTVAGFLHLDKLDTVKMPDGLVQKKKDGGVLDGWSPGRDVHRFVSPTGGELHLSGGEAIMRPEFTAAVGPRTIDRWNLLARSGRLGRNIGGAFKDGGILGRSSFFGGGIWDGISKVGGKVGHGVGAIGDLVGNAAGIIKDPTKIIKKILDAATSTMRSAFGDTAWTDLAIGAPTALADGMVDAIKGLIGVGSGDGGNSGSGGGSAPSGPSNPSGNQAIGKALAQSMFGWTGSDWNSLYALWMRESGWNQYADNPTSSAYGIPQSLPGSKMASAGSDWLTNPATQIKWGLQYIHDRYGDPDGAWAHSQATGWYDQGGYLPPGVTTVFNGTGKPEPVFNPQQWDLLQRSAGGGPTELSGALYLDSGEYLGHVRGTVKQVLAEGRSATADMRAVNRAAVART